MAQQSWKLTLEYDGSRYSGWQEQTNAHTIAGAFREAAEEYFGDRVEFQASGRTDAGVHALGQVLHLRAEVTRTVRPEVLLRELNHRLPGSVVVVECEPAARNFHARHDAVARSYVYRISTRKTAFEKRYVWWVKERLDLQAMSRAATLLPGRHDFTAFRAPDPSKPGESPIVIVHAAEVEQDSYMIFFRITASHFLWRMVRRLTGCLVRVGTGEVGVEQVERLLTGTADPNLDIAAWTAPASGLFLEHVEY